MKKTVFTILLIVFVSLQGISQQQRSIKLLAKVKSNSIWLRWAPNDPTTWIMGNTNGYQIERYTIVRGNTLLSKPEKVILQTIRPKPVEQWQEDASVNRYSAIAAQAIYGKTFQVKVSNTSDLAQVINQSREQEQRFSFALFAADQSFNTAKLSALGFQDGSVKIDERYLYRVSVLIGDEKAKSDTALFYIGLKDSVRQTAPISLQAKFGDRHVQLRWPRFAVEREYTSFIVERAEAKGEFKRINKLPLINTLAKEETHFQAMDSLPQNGVEYLYRIRGMDAFGDAGPESERVAGKGFKLLNATAAIKSAREKNEMMVINWESSGDRNSITGFSVERSRTVNGTFEAINQSVLSSMTFTYMDDKPLSTSYYRIKVLGENGQENFSFPYLAQLTDSVPPSPPKGLRIVIDTLGVAKLTWTPNQERDLLGYRVYRSNFAKSEYSQVNRDPFLQASYLDSVNINRLDSKIYYKLVAVDRRFNPSDFSEPVAVELPDIVPPLPPVIESIRSTSKGVRISWVPSASDDVVAYRVLRRLLASASWDTLKILRAQDSLVFNDKSLVSGKEYQYSIIAIDKSKLKSPLSHPATGRIVNNLIKPAIIDFKVEIDRNEKSVTLSWNYNELNLTKFLIYRSVNDEPLSLYKSVSGNSFSWKDVNLRMGDNYVYRLKASFKNGLESEFSEPVLITY
ncbi:MAG: hypothetical protein ACK5RG_07635 [Cyclobacteriaceae bacterium]|jgi:fibronectin type 3 domain-containing protein|nr:hypothetical protein [Flammeovirgaceae bacterium]